jgi:hypothetical protein
MNYLEKQVNLNLPPADGRGICLVEGPLLF